MHTEDSLMFVFQQWDGVETGGDIMAYVAIKSIKSRLGKRLIPCCDGLLEMAMIPYTHFMLIRQRAKAFALRRGWYFDGDMGGSKSLSRSQRILNFSI
jgi:hypothetical protein